MTFEIVREELSYATTMASGDGAMTLATETSRYDEKPVEMANPSKDNNLAMTTAQTTAATVINIALPAAAMTKGKAPAAAMTKGKAPAAMTMILLHEEQREATIVVEIHRRTSRAKGMILHRPHQATPMAAAAAQRGHASPEQNHRITSPTTRVPT
jgi:hypothetical protein